LLGNNLLRLFVQAIKEDAIFPTIN